MANKFAVLAQQITLGTATNGFRLTVYYDFGDHSICKMVVDNIAGTLAATTILSFNRNGLEIPNSRVITTIPAQDANVAIPLELNSGDLADSLLAHGPGFGV